MTPFNDLYHQHYRLLFNVTYKMCGNRDEAADVVREVFVALFQNQQQGQQISYPKSWLYSATLNKCSDNSRYRSRFVNHQQQRRTFCENTGHCGNCEQQHVFFQFEQHG